MVDILKQAGLVETYVDPSGRAAMRLTSDGERVARQMALSSEDDQEALLAALVEAAEEGT
jgi:DNA-binding MarR family transcriptional regulator